MSRLPRAYGSLALLLTFVGAGPVLAAGARPKDQVVLLTPADRAVLSFSHPATAGFDLTWRAVPGATGYRLLVGEAPDLARPLVDRKVAEPFVKIHGLRPGRYHWRVEAILAKAGPLTSRTASLTVKAVEGGAVQ
jgi:hypothetical protein